MENGLGVEILWLESVDSTQRYLIEALKSGELSAPVCVGASLQTSGKGSRGNSWVGKEGNLFISIALKRRDLPKDLKLESSSIYLAMLMKEVLEKTGSDVWIKWPNDFYAGEVKVGGLITAVLQDTLVCGIGINLLEAPEGYGSLNSSVSPLSITKYYGERLQSLPSWKQIFSKFRLEFERSKIFSTHFENRIIELKNAVLCEDGSLECNGQRMYSLR